MGRSNGTEGARTGGLYRALLVALIFGVLIAAGVTFRGAAPNAPAENQDKRAEVKELSTLTATAPEGKTLRENTPRKTEAEAAATYEQGPVKVPSDRVDLLLGMLCPEQPRSRAREEAEKGREQIDRRRAVEDGCMQQGSELLVEADRKAGER